MDQNKTGKFIAQLRREQGLTQKELTDKISVSDKAVSKWETGKGFPDIWLLESLANSLDIKVSDIIAGEIIEDTNITENIVTDIVDATINEQEKKTKMFNWIIAITISKWLWNLMIQKENQTLKKHHCIQFPWENIC